MVMQSAWMTRARRHLAIDCGAKVARRCAGNLARNLTRLAEILPGGVLQIHSSNQTTAPQPWSSGGSQVGLAIEVRYIPDGANSIAWDIHLYGRQYYGRRGQYTYATVPQIPNLYQMRERLVMVDMPLRTATYMSQIVARAEKANAERGE